MSKIFEEHQLWLKTKRNNSFNKDATGKYDDNAQPWTALGYTTDNTINTETPDKNNDVLNSSTSTLKSSSNTMLIPNILNVAINLFFIYLIVSLFLSALQEQIVVLLALRAKNLKSSIEILLGDGDQKTRHVTNQLYEQPLIKSINQQGNKWLKELRNGSLNTFFYVLLMPVNLVIQFLKSFNIVENSDKKIAIKTNWESIGPSYLKSETFSDTLLELLRQDYDLAFDTYSDDLDGIISQLENELERRQNLSPNSTENETSKLSQLPKELLKNLYALARQSKNRVVQGRVTLKQFQENIANWFDESMERATGVYKRNAFGLSLLLAFVIAAIGNIDTIYITNQLYNDPTLNETLSGFVTEEVNTIQSQCQDKSEAKYYQCIKEKFNEINVNDIHSFPIGWEVHPKIQTEQSNFFNYDIHFKQQQSSQFAILGWIITALALAQGAPFWFDLLNNVVNIRLAGKRYDSAKDTQEKQKSSS